jgi:CDP-glycerol glycerophosphotransferase
VRIVYNSFGGQYSDSPRAIHEALLGRGREFTHTWLSSPAHQHDFPPGVQTVPFGGPASVAALESADFVVSNNHVDLDWEKRPGTTYLQTWHGTPLKRIHHDVLWAPAGRLEYLSEDVARWDHLLSPNRASTERLRRGFAFPGEVHETGYPRNDVLSAPDRGRTRAAVRAALGISHGVTAVLYTPTWRDDLVFGAGGPDFALHLDLADFAARLGEDHVLLLRLHRMVSDRLHLVPGRPVQDVTAYPDVRDLYLAADLMVTDYSSTMFDFAVTGKPMLFFTYDLDHFRGELRGFYFDLAAHAPGPLLGTSADVVEAVQDVRAVTAAHAGRYARFREVFCHLDDGHATDRVLDRFFPPRAPGAVPVPTTRRGDDHVDG